MSSTKSQEAILTELHELRFLVASLSSKVNSFSLSPINISTHPRSFINAIID
jgi:hypothetical protein